MAFALVLEIGSNSTHAGVLALIQWEKEEKKDTNLSHVSYSEHDEEDEEVKERHAVQVATRFCVRSITSVHQPSLPVERAGDSDMPQPQSALEKEMQCMHPDVVFVITSNRQYTS